MKLKLLILLCISCLVNVINAQSPQAIPFQAVIRDNNGVLIPNQNISIRISIHTGVAAGTIVYREKQLVSTNNLGLVTLNIGLGTADMGTFSAINWGGGSKFVQLEVDLSGLGSSYVDMGTSQLLSVPYALYALNSASGVGGSGTQPASQIVYGGAHGLISDGNFTRDSATGEVDLMIMPSGATGTFIKEDSDGVLMLHLNSTQSKLAMVGVGNPHNMMPHLDTLMVVACIADLDSNIIYGFHASADSSEIVTNAPGGGRALGGNYGLVGCSQYSSYSDVAYNNGTSLNSITIDSVGVHWEYNDTSRYTFPLRDGNSGQVLSTNGSGILQWVNGSTLGGGFAAPAATRIPYAGNAGLISDGNFTRDSITQKTQIICHPAGTSYMSGLGVDSNSASLMHADGATGYINLLVAGHNSEYHFAPNSVVAATIDGSQNVMHGFYAMNDSTEMITTALDNDGNYSNTTYYGLAGTQAYSAYLDVLYNHGNSLNSFTLDSTGVHWEYNDTNQYTFPLRDGAPGAVITTDGSGHLSFQSGSSGSPWTVSAGTVVLSDNTKPVSIGNTSGFPSNTLNMNGSVLITDQQSGNILSGFRLDSFRVDMFRQNTSNMTGNIISAGYEDFFTGPGNTDSSAIVAIAVDANANVMHGFYATPNLSEMMTSALGHSGHFAINTYYGLVGTQAWSAYLDCSYNNGSSLNSFTLDSTGLHFEYNDTDRYTLPITDGKPGQVLSTNGSGNLSWSNPIPNKSLFTPSTGDNISLVSGSNIINPSSGLAALTITLPSSPTDNETVYMTFTNTITAITYSGGTVVGGLSTISSVSSGSVKYWLTYDSSSNKWY